MGTSSATSASGALNPFPSPFAGGVNPLAHIISPEKIIPIVFFIIFAIWAIYTIVAAYHWFRYGHRSWFAVPALALHLFVSGCLALYMMSGLR
ncbi:MAG: hypothetical protein V4480_04305 [Patescibacteria group bacterium]